MKNKDLQIRDPFVLPVQEKQLYYLFGSTDKNIWGEGTGFDLYISRDLEEWEGPFPAFRPDENFFAKRNFWAPEVHSYKGSFYMLATFRRTDNELLGTAILAADRVEGPYLPHSSGPVTPAEWACLDGTLHVDAVGEPWMVFCHEWTQTGDGEICAMRLNPDLRGAAGEPVRLFSASQAPWTERLASKSTPEWAVYVTDGPFLYRDAEGRLLMLWASFADNRYAQGVAVSHSGEVTGPWVHQPEPLYRENGGHGMLFRTFGGELMLALHAPNRTPEERPLFLPVAEGSSGGLSMRLLREG